MWNNTRGVWDEKRFQPNLQVQLQQSKQLLQNIVVRSKEQKHWPHKNESRNKSRTGNRNRTEISKGNENRARTRIALLSQFSDVQIPICAKSENQNVHETLEWWESTKVLSHPVIITHSMCVVITDRVRQYFHKVPINRVCCQSLSLLNECQIKTSAACWNVG